MTAPLQVLIVDDEPLARARLRRLLGDCRQPAAVAAAEADSAPHALALVRSRPFDVLLLDIHMPGASGLHLAEALRELPPGAQVPQIIFVTAHAEHALQAFELQAADYLTKPVRLERLQTALQKAARLATPPVPAAPPSASPPAAMPPARPAAPGPTPPAAPAAGGGWLLITAHGKTQRVSLDEVLYFKAELKYITVRTATASYLLDGSLSELAARHAGRFLRIHRNALVARHAIRALVRQHDATEGEGWALRLAGLDDELLPVSRRQVAAVREAL